MIDLKKIWHRVTGRDPRLNDDGTMTTKHGNRIIPYQVKVSRRGGLSANVAEFMFQPRVGEIKKQVECVDYSQGQTIILDKDSGDFYLKNANESDIDVRAKTPLGQIDVELEESIFRKALELHKMNQLFGDCSPENPVVLDQTNGRVYPANNPSETRGYVGLGPEVHNPNRKTQETPAQTAKAAKNEPIIK